MVERAMRAFKQLGFVEVLENSTYYIPEIEQMTGKGLSGGERKAKYRRQKAEGSTPLLTDTNMGMGQKWDNAPHVSQFCPPGIRDKRIENRDKNLDQRECDRETHTRPYGKFGNVILIEQEYHALMEKNVPVLMTSFPKLLNALGGIYSGKKNEYLKSLSRYQFLIIDDLGVERDTPYALETV